MQKLFVHSFQEHTPEAVIEPIVSSLNRIDAIIQRVAPEWPIDRIAKIDLSILRLAIYELVIEQKEPPKVIIDEAIELAKAFGNPSSPAFINGALGAVMKELNNEQPTGDHYNA